MLNQILIAMLIPTGLPVATESPCTYKTTQTIDDDASDVLSLADMDGDNDLDLVLGVDSFFEPGHFAIWWNLGDGVLAEGPNYGPYGNSTVGLYPTHLNSDNRMDLVVLASGFNAPHQEVNPVYLLIQDDEGILGIHDSFGATPLTSGGAVGDIDRDGDIDIVTMDRKLDELTVLRTNGNAEFESAEVYTFPTDVAGRQVALGDFDDDQDLDVAVPAPGIPGIWVFLNDGKGSLTGPTGHAGIGAMRTIDAADLNDDGTDDIVTNASFGAAVYLSNGDGTFAPAVHYVTGHDTEAATVGDMNNDSYVDIVVMNNAGNDFTVLLNDGNGTFRTSSPVPTLDQPKAIVVGDLSGNSFGDVITSSNGNGHWRSHLGSCEVACPADLDMSAQVDTPDLLQLLAAWGPCSACPEDLDSDQQVGTGDLLVLLAAWGDC